MHINLQDHNSQEDDIPDTLRCQDLPPVLLVLIDSEDTVKMTDAELHALLFPESSG